jgi:hypothetical protein
MEYNKNKTNFGYPKSLNAYNNGYHMVPIKRGKYTDIDSDDELETKYNLNDIDSKGGWNIIDLETLYEMGFQVQDDTTMVCEVEIVSLDEKAINHDQVKSHPIHVYKSNEGYVMTTQHPKRRYVFESFDKMLDYIEHQ